MATSPEARARLTIDALLNAAGWDVQDVAAANIHAGRGVALREFPLNTGFGYADYLLYVDGKACGVIEAKKEGATLSGVEMQSGRYAKGLPASLPAWHRPLPFLFESTGVETHFTNGLDPQPRARNVFAFFRPELLADWLSYLSGAPGQPAANDEARTFLHRMRNMPQLVTQWGAGGANFQLWPAQIQAIENLEKSLAANKPKALIQMATGSGKPQPQWLRASFDALDQRQSNLQFQIGGEFAYARCERVRSERIAAAVAQVWLACRPMVHSALTAG